MNTKYLVCYMADGGFEMYLETLEMLYFSHWAHSGLTFDTKESAQAAIASFKGRYRDCDLAALYVKAE